MRTNRPAEGPAAINSGTEVRMTDTVDQTITIRCSISYWFILYKFDAVLIPVLCFLTIILPSGRPSSLLAIALTLLFIIKALLGALKISCMRWVITQEEILITRGIFNKCTDRTELYRVCDYQSSQSFLEYLFGFWTCKIMATDTNMSEIYIFGIRKNEPLLIEIRHRVENQKEKKPIVEITNH